MTRRDIAIVPERRAEAGLPVLSCPNCGEKAAHYEPPTLGRDGGFTCAPRSWSFLLAVERAPKGLSMNDRSHWRTKAASTAWVRGEVVARVVAAGVPTLDRCRVDVEWVVGTRHKRDTDNLAPFLKAIYDGIGADRGISAHVVPDDAPEFMEKRGATIRYEKGATAHFEVTITEVTG